MKLLRDILYKTRIEEVIGSTNVAIESICFDSRKVERFSFFVAIRGEVSDGHAFIQKAIQTGAIAILCEDIPDQKDEKVTYIKVKNTSEALAIVAANFYENPSEKLKLVGVTGTNGKTTSVTLLYNLFKLLGYKTGMLSTVCNYIDGEQVPATHTTPDALQLNQLLQRMVEKGCTHCFMEVSSHAVVQHRITALEFSGAAFTNITHDHLDYHKTFDNYIKAKKGFFDGLPATAFALVNKDDKNGEVMLQNTRALKKTYAINSMADFKCRIIENQFSGLLLTIDGKEFYSKLIGTFNAYNLLLAYSIGVLLKEDSTNVLTALSTLNAVEGRFQYLRSANKITGIIDYAHTPDALKNVLTTINDIRTGNEKVITLVGCGGDRDALKRPLMAKIACDLSDKVILTSDNPRSENPEEIIEQMKKGILPPYNKKSLSIVDRREAIKTACSLAQPGDIILVAGKGHEKYQEIKGVKYPFDDLEELKNSFELLD
ncbi:MAG TPA: UDP-N-acetylmuramoyl-L-alanyl-D-glutamate--2,6-diaminopimelate ligase [Bacteroidia bacterium]|nr:UDP-N-acetylmuramoyl-L-alanyl-D-glutamate--2,6-diaminopimelate ligase [Bacteroidia bacterium]HRH07973.1 UDP-N-acetylmuramoyl-L-alanyl-D-glutamate--2,6-diaminopimelate ligase [Bacteroidia bacterium]